MSSPQCPICGGKMAMMYGDGWDYDRWMCTEWAKPMVLCQGEIELDESTYPDGYDEATQ